MRIRLSDEDRERLGCPEWLDYDKDHLAVGDAEALEAAGGDYTVYPLASLAGARARVWVALHRAGVTVSPYEALSFDLLGMSFEGVASPGKADSATAAGGTRSKSPGSARRTRSKT